MTCCGKAMKRAANIGQGYFWTTLESLFVLPKNRCERASSRLDRCRRCEMGTWLTKREFGVWIQKEVGVVKAATELHKTETGPLLPKLEQASGRKLFCRICKCGLPAKSYVRDEQCPLGHWQDI